MASIYASLPPFPSGILFLLVLFFHAILTVLVHCKIVLFSLLFCSLSKSFLEAKYFFCEFFFKCRIPTNWMFQSKNTNIRRYLLNYSLESMAHLPLEQTKLLHLGEDSCSWFWLLIWFLSLYMLQVSSLTNHTTLPNTGTVETRTQKDLSTSS